MCGTFNGSYVRKLFGIILKALVDENLVTTVREQFRPLAVNFEHNCLTLLFPGTKNIEPLIQRLVNITGLSYGYNATALLLCSQFVTC